MSVLIDASTIIAFLHRRDPSHALGKAMLTPLFLGERGPAAVNDSIVDEVLTLLVACGAA